MAPEFLKKEDYTVKVDIWSLGCILYELCSLNYCFEDKAFFNLVSKIFSGKHEEIDLKLYSPQLQKLIDLSLNIDYKKRLDIENFYKIIIKLSNPNEMIIKYAITKSSKIRIFGDKFVKNNKNNCRIIVENTKKELCTYINTKDLKSQNDFLLIKLIEENQVIDMSSMFFDCNDLLELNNISKWDTTNVIDISYMFYNCYKLST